jgi:hypothetical protein
MFINRNILFLSTTNSAKNKEKYYLNLTFPKFFEPRSKWFRYINREQSCCNKKFTLSNTNFKLIMNQISYLNNFFVSLCSSYDHYI